MGSGVGADEVRLGLVQAWAQAQVPGLKVCEWGSGLDSRVR